MRPVGRSVPAEPRLSTPKVDFCVDPSRYRHWRLTSDGPVATLATHVDEGGGLVPGYELKLNIYDLGVDIEFYDAVQRLRFEHPEVRAVVLTSGKEKIFCAGANIRMLAASPHPWKVNLCTFTNETRNGIEDATVNSGQAYLAAVNGSAFGGGYELALACQHIMIIDDQSSVVSLSKVPLLGVGPGTGGLTRLIDKRHVRRDLADYFASKAEGVGGKKAVQWRLVDEAVPRARWQETVAERTADLAERSARLAGATGIELTPLDKTRTDDEISYRYVTALLEPGLEVAEITVSRPERGAPSEVAGMYEQHTGFWPLAVTRGLDDLILDLRTNEPEVGTWVLRTRGDAGRVLAYDRLLPDNRGDWLANEVIHYLKRLDVTSRSLIALIEPGSCFAGSLLELALAADQSFQLSDVFGEADPGAGPAAITIGEMNLGPLPMGNGLTRLETRYLGNDADLAEVEKRAGDALEAQDAGQLGLVTCTPNDADWGEEIRIIIEERASFSPDAFAGLDTNYRFAGPETIETKIFGRLSAWKNWIFNGPHASGLESMYLREITKRVQQYEKRASLIDASNSKAKNNPVSGAIEYMKGHIGEAISVAGLAEGACMSESAFAYLFKHCTGTSPCQFLKLLRLEHARGLLLENRIVSEAARCVGYSSLSHFSEFKRYFGETPRPYLQRLQGIDVFNLHGN
ncbi:MAG TPA: 2,3-epoxybenzoyl-CoA dihydrolase [Streptosporangiaceae bacterium]